MNIKNWFKKRTTVQTVSGNTNPNKTEPENPERAAMQEIMRHISSKNILSVTLLGPFLTNESETVYKIRYNWIDEVIYIKNNHRKDGLLIGRSIKVDDNPWIRFDIYSEEGKLLGQILGAAIAWKTQAATKIAAKQSRNYQQILNDMRGR